MSVTVILPMPDSILSGHANGNNKWKIIGLTKKMRERAFMEGKVAMGRKETYAKATVSYRFCVKTNTRQDTENMRHRCKAYVDGLVDAGVMAGDHWQVLESGPATVEIDKENPRVEITVKPTT